MTAASPTQTSGQPLWASKDKHDQARPDTLKTRTRTSHFHFHNHVPIPAMSTPLSSIENTKDTFRPSSDLQPAPKRRKLATTGNFASSQSATQSSFAEVLARLKEDASESKGACFILWRDVLVHGTFTGAEGGADSWARPELPVIDEQKDTISA